jgi:hypothetical protein
MRIKRVRVADLSIQNASVPSIWDGCSTDIDPLALQGLIALDSSEYNELTPKGMNPYRTQSLYICPEKGALLSDIVG